MASRFEIDGSYEQGNGTMVISLADNNSKSQAHDSFIVEGDVELGGALELEIIDPFSLVLNDNSDILEVGGSLKGTFKNLPEGALVSTYQSDDGQYHDIRITYKGGDGNDISLTNQANGSDILGSITNDNVKGTYQADYINAKEGDDKLFGGRGADVLTGGRGSDKFIYHQYIESKNGADHRDVITDFSSSEADKIDLSSIGKDFVFIGSSVFSGDQPDIRFDNGILQLATAGYNNSPLFEIQLLGVESLTIDDLIL